jgi:hypothetical protein
VGSWGGGVAGSWGRGVEGSSFRDSRLEID